MRAYLISLLLAIVSAKFHEPAYADAEKRNTEDELLPHFNILGYTDLDVLDFFSGAAERAYDRDVRKNWHYCFQHITWAYIWKHVLSLNMLRVIIAGTWFFLADDQREAQTFQILVPRQCKTMAREFG